MLLVFHPDPFGSTHRVGWRTFSRLREELQQSQIQMHPFALPQVEGTKRKRIYPPIISNESEYEYGGKKIA
jgi:hypothetical protein